MNIWAVARFSTSLPSGVRAFCPRGSAHSGARALTLREAVLIDNRNEHRPIFIKTVVKIPTPVGPKLPRYRNHRRAWPNARLGKIHKCRNRPICPWIRSLNRQKPPIYHARSFYNRTFLEKRKAPAEPPVINFDFIELFAASTPTNPSLWEVALLFRRHSKTFASLGRTKCPIEITKEIVATAFSKRASGMASITNLARFAGTFFQFALTNDYPPSGEDALISVAQWVRPMHERGYTVPRGPLYALRVVNEAIGLQLPLTDPAVLGDARIHRSKSVNRRP